MASSSVMISVSLFFRISESVNKFWVIRDSFPGLPVMENCYLRPYLA
jgi:hypothetical protein